MSLKNREGCAILNEYCAALIFLFLNSQFSNNILRTDRFVAYDSSDSFGKHIGNA